MHDSPTVGDSQVDQPLLEQIGLAWVQAGAHYRFGQGILVRVGAVGGRHLMADC